jgi:hypothetical protein
MTREERNQTILVLVKTRSYSYEVIAQMMGCSRGAVAGVVFRERYPVAIRVASLSGKHNVIGTGKRLPTYRAATSKRDLRRLDRPRRSVIQAP